MKNYYEAHVTFLGERERAKRLVEHIGWKFSAIDGDSNLGEGVKLYATTQLNSKKLSQQQAVDRLVQAAGALEREGFSVLRRKVELVIFDDRSSLVRPCDGMCPECVG